MKDKPKEQVKIDEFEKDLKRLEEIVKELENGDQTLEESLKKFEEGIRLARRCEKVLAEAERRIEILIQNENGELEPQPFDISNIENEENNSIQSDKAKTKRTGKVQPIEGSNTFRNSSDFDEGLPF